MKRLIRLMHRPPFRQGLEWHSSTSYSQFTPWKPGLHCGRETGFWCRLGPDVDPPPSEKPSPCTGSCPDNPCRWPRCGRGWTDTRPPGPRSSCPCTPAGRCTDGSSPHSCTARRSYTHSPRPHLTKRHTFTMTPRQPRLFLNRRRLQGFLRLHVVKTRLFWQQSSGRTCLGRRSTARSIPPDSGTPRRWWTGSRCRR